MYRPLPGFFNLFAWLWIKTHRKKAVLWNVECCNKKSLLNPEQLATRVLSKVREGSIVAYAENGEGPWKNTVLSLEIICQRILEVKKLPLVRLKFPEWTMMRRFVFVVWEFWEHFYAWFFDVERISSTNIFRLTKRKYKGPDLFEDGRLMVKTGGIAGEIHIESNRLQGNDHDLFKVALRVRRLARESFPEMARYVAENPKYKDVKIFWGLTMIYGAEKFGFHVQNIPISGLGRGVYFLKKLITWIYNPTYKSRSSGLQEKSPEIVWISREKLLEKWLNKE